MLKKMITPGKHEQAQTYISFGGLAGFAAVCVIQLSVVPENLLDTKLLVALYCFAGSLPMLILELINTALESGYKYTVADPKYVSMPVVAGVLGTCLGTVLLFWHFSQIVGVIFLISFIYCVVVHLKIQEYVIQVNHDGRDSSGVSNRSTKDA